MTVKSDETATGVAIWSCGVVTKGGYRDWLPDLIVPICWIPEWIPWKPTWKQQTLLAIVRALTGANQAANLRTDGAYRRAYHSKP